MTKSRVCDELHISIYVVQLTLTASMYIYIRIHFSNSASIYVIYPIYYIIMMQVQSPGHSDDVCHV